MRDNVSSQILVRWTPYFIFLTAKAGRTVIPSSFLLLIFVGLQVPWAKTERKLRWRSQTTGCLKSKATQPKRHEKKRKLDNKKYCCSSVYISRAWSNECFDKSTVSEDTPNDSHPKNFHEILQFIRKTARADY